MAQEEPSSLDAEVEARTIAAERLLRQCRNLSHRAALHSHRLAAEGDSLAEEVAQVYRHVMAERDLAVARAERDPRWRDESKALEVASSLLEGSGPGGDLRRFQPRRTPLALRLLMGHAVDTVALRGSRSQALREEYHSFRQRSALIMLVTSSLLHVALLRVSDLSEAAGALGLASPASAGRREYGAVTGARPPPAGGGGSTPPPRLPPVFIVCTQLFLCWMMYFYVASAVRQSVLQLNGSRIRPWWVRHHYFALAGGALLLSLPASSPTYSIALGPILRWSTLQSFVMLAQNRYQRRHLYKRIALGRGGSMDVIGGETSGVEGQLFILYPLLFALQAVQLYVGLLLVSQTRNSVMTATGLLEWEAEGSDLWGSRGFFLVGLLMIIMDCQNFRYTIQTMLEKRRYHYRSTRIAKESVDEELVADLASATHARDDAPEGAQSDRTAATVSPDGDKKKAT